MKIFVKGNFFTYIDANNLVWIDNCENAIVYKNSTESTNYNILLKSSNTRFTDIPFASINDETNTPYATQNIFEEYIYENTGVRFQQPLITLDDLNDVVLSAPANGQVIEYNSTSGKWENVSPSALGGDMTQAVYDTDSDGVFDGIDIDFEGGVLSRDGIVYGNFIKEVVDYYRNQGKEFWLTLAMEYPYLIKGVSKSDFFINFS